LGEKEGKEKRKTMESPAKFYQEGGGKGKRFFPHGVYDDKREKKN